MNNISVRNLSFDLHTDLKGLKSILDFRPNYLRIYQFEKPVPNTLHVSHLFKQSKFKILKQNGLKHFFWIEFEFATIYSFNNNFLKSIRQNFE